MVSAAMRSYFAAQGRFTYAGGWYAVLAWADEQIKKDLTPIKVLTARPGEGYARVIAEITKDGMRLIEGGRQVPVRSLNGKA